MKILKQLDLNNVVFIDIETAALTPELIENTPQADAWAYKNKTKGFTEWSEMASLYLNEASLHAEFSKIICITIGKIKEDKIKMKSYTGQEADLLKAFCTDLTNIIASNKSTVLCGHSITGFDIPFIMRRCMVHQVEPPTLIDVAALKPWEVTAIDIATLWKGSGFTGASAMAIAFALDLASPKDEMAGHQITEIYYNTKDSLQRIQKYCEDDVLTVANIVLRCRFEPLVERTNEVVTTEKVGAMEHIYNNKFSTSAQENTILRQLESMSTTEVKMANDILKVVMPKKAKVK